MRADLLNWVAQAGLALTRCRTLTDALEAMAVQLGAAPFLLRGYVILVEEETLRTDRVVSFGRAPTLPAALSLAGSLAGAAITDGRMVIAPTDAPSAAAWERTLASNSTLICVSFRGAASRGVIVAALPDGTVDNAEYGVCLQNAATLMRSTLDRIGECEAKLRQHMQQIDDVHTGRLALIGRLTAAIAHEINNPLQAIASTLYLLRHRPLSDEKRQRYLEMAQQETERVIASVRRMLDLYRSSEQGKRPVALHRILDQAIQQAGDVLHERGIVVHRIYTLDDLRVSGFAGHLRYACYNLILSSAYAMPKGGTLTIRTYRQNEGMVQYAVAEFADTGTPIDEADLLRLFDPDGPMRGEANGIELPLSYSIIEQHHGTLTAQHTADQVVFRMCLPEAT
ncbi:MAG: sensor histidine kinase [Roseiflexus sp.]